MKILVYSLNTAPELVGVGKYTGDMAEYFAAHGEEVVVVSAPPYYPDWRVWPGYGAWRYSVERSERSLTQRCPHLGAGEAFGREAGRCTWRPSRPPARRQRSGALLGGGRTSS